MILAVAGSNPVGHPINADRRSLISAVRDFVAYPVLKRIGVITTSLSSPASRALKANFWAELLCDKSMEPLSDLERLVTGCEIIAALDDLELLDDATR